MTVNEIECGKMNKICVDIFDNSVKVKKSDLL